MNKHMVVRDMRSRKDIIHSTHTKPLQKDKKITNQKRAKYKPCNTKKDPTLVESN